MATLPAGVRPANPARIHAPDLWTPALAAYLAAKAAEDAYDRDTYMPAYERCKAAVEKHGPGNIPVADVIPDEVEIEMDRLQDVRNDAEAIMMAIPSPDPVAFARKFLVAHGDDRGADCWDAMLEAEARRFVGEC